MVELAEVPQQLETKRIQFPPTILVLAGPPLTGKTTIAHEIAKQSNFQVFYVDEARHMLFPPTDKPLTQEQERFQMMEAYKLNLERAKAALEKNIPAIVTATFSREPYHEMLKKLMHDTNMPLHLIYTEVNDENVVNERIESRKQKRDRSNILSYDGFLSVANRLEKPHDIPYVTLDTNQPPEVSAAQIISSMQQGTTQIAA